MTKVFSETELLKKLLDDSETMHSMMRYKSLSVKEDGILILFQLKVDLNMRDIFMKTDNRPRPFLILSSKDKIIKIIKEIEFEKENDKK